MARLGDPAAWIGHGGAAAPFLRISIIFREVHAE
jgi:hypothetical protein